MSTILLIGDLVGYGNLGTSVMFPILSKMGFELFRLPSSLVSNNFAYGDFALFDTTEYMSQCIEIWEKHSFRPDAVATGYLVSEKQTKIVADYCKKLKSLGSTVFVDPIMADDGKLYNGASAATVAYMREICDVADVIVPNFTEAKFLADKFLDKNSLSWDESVELIATLREKTDKSVVISSMVTDDENCTLVYDKFSRQTSKIPYKLIPMQFSGTGDVFSSVLIGRYLQGDSLFESVNKAMTFVANCISKNPVSQYPDNGIPVEKHFNDIP